MCGITGFLVDGPPGDSTSIVHKMNEGQRHRGPDDQGIWTDDAMGVALGHRRLTVVDLSSAAHQPMQSASGRYIVVFNGEIYIHLDLRKRLTCTGYYGAWRGHSDTETLLAYIDVWGFERALAAINGMFAMAVWDRQRNALLLARDRMGEKPLYYGWQGDVFLFGSELKALRAHPAFGAEIDRGALTLFLRHNYVPTPYSIFRGIRKLPAGTWLEVSTEQRANTPTLYWALVALAEQGSAEPFRGSEAAALDRLEAIMLKAVQGQMMSDVPLGALLSGGIDSSIICALMQANSSQAIKTFTIGFSEEHYNEAEHARAVAKHLGTDHTELHLSADTALSIVPKLPEIWDEPFADSSQLPTFLVMQLARRSVTVALSGDGGDELFCGYNRYSHAPRTGCPPRYAKALAHS